jgi:hypothetical protein
MQAFTTKRSELPSKSRSSRSVVRIRSFEELKSECTLQQKVVDSTRRHLKEWETQFKQVHGGSKATSKDIKLNPRIRKLLCLMMMLFIAGAIVLCPANNLFLKVTRSRVSPSFASFFVFCLFSALSRCKIPTICSRKSQA